jgi:ATP adenylyltransferase/5',5'''-P-1,P-4-tetraphosphate phosphorylase II
VYGINKFEFQVCPALRSKPGIQDSTPQKTGNDVLATISKPESTLPPLSFATSDIYHGDESFFLTRVLDNHYLILNKFCVYRPQYILLTNDALRRQHEALTESDFFALCSVLDEPTSVDEKPLYAFFNCGEDAGCSRNHKHMQFFHQTDFALFPSNFDSTTNLEDAVPNNHGLDVASERSPLMNQLHAPYKYFFSRIPEHHPGTASRARTIFQTYTSLLVQAAHLLSVPLCNKASGAAPPHNMVMTRDWILVIPRRRGYWNGAAANAAAMMGLVWVSSDEQMHLWRRLGPARVLAELGVPAEA